MAQNVSDVRPITTSEAVTWRKGGKFGTTANQAGYSGAGSRVDGVFSRDGASGDGVGLRLLNAGGTFVITMVTSCSVGDLLYAAASGKFSTTPSGAPVFVALQVATTDGDEIEAVAVGNGGGNALLYSNTAASTAISNTTTPTDFSLAYTLPANSMAAGDVYRIKGQGIATATNSTDTLAVDVEFGGVDLFTIAAADVADNDIFVFEADVLIRTIGASGTLVAQGFGGAFGAAGTATARSRFKASTTIDTTAAALVVAEATWSVASASNSCRLDCFTVERLRK